MRGLKKLLQAGLVVLCVVSFFGCSDELEDLEKNIIKQLDINHALIELYNEKATENKEKYYFVKIYDAEIRKQDKEWEKRDKELDRRVSELAKQANELNRQSNELDRQIERNKIIEIRKQEFELLKQINLAREEQATIMKNGNELLKLLNEELEQKGISLNFCSYLLEDAFNIAIQGVTSLAFVYKRFEKYGQYKQAYARCRKYTNLKQICTKHLGIIASHCDF